SRHDRKLLWLYRLQPSPQLRHRRVVQVLSPASIQSGSNESAGRFFLFPSLCITRDRARSAIPFLCVKDRYAYSATDRTTAGALEVRSGGATLQPWPEGQST